MDSHKIPSEIYITLVKPLEGTAYFAGQGVLFAFSESEGRRLAEAEAKSLNASGFPSTTESVKVK